MVTRRQAVGAHYGLKDWLVQRVTAVLMALYTLLVLAIALWNGGIDHALWKSLFASGAFRLASFLFMVALLYHAWIGVRDIFMDYIKPVGPAARARRSRRSSCWSPTSAGRFRLLWGVKA